MMTHLYAKYHWLRIVVPLLVFALVSGCSSQQRPPVLVNAAPLEYPASARDAGIEGFVRVSYRVEADGRVSNVRVIDAQPAQVFDASAVAAVSAWRFSPALIDGMATAVDYRESTLTFKLGDTDQYQRSRY